MSYYPIILKGEEELSSRGKTWMKLKCILQSERSQPEKSTCSVILTILEKAKI